MLILFLICKPTTITAQNKVVVLDSVQAKKIIIELTDYDLCKEQRQLYESKIKEYLNLDRVQNERMKELNNSYNSLLTAFNYKVEQTTILEQINSNNARIIKKETRKRRFWQYACYGLAGFVVYDYLKTPR